MCDLGKFYDLKTVFMLFIWHILVFIFTVSLITAKINLVIQYL